VIEIGKTSTLTVASKNSAGFLLTDGAEEVLLPTRLAPEGLAPGQKVGVFVYTDSEDRPVATTQKPLAEVGEFACLRVIDQSSHGAFLDWGLDKDLFVPFAEQHEKLVIGQKYVFAVYLDNHTGRVAAASKLGSFLDYDVSNLQEDQPVEVVVYSKSDRGAQVIVSDRYSGMVHTSELFSPVEIGQSLSGFIVKIRDDNKLDIRLRRVGKKGKLDATETILAALEEAGGVLALGDKSPPEAIIGQLGMSKKVFKSAIGGLYKAGKVLPGPLETRLKKCGKRRY
jgi:predicted RNA-binding protein (virulence factor B family)